MGERVVSAQHFFKYELLANASNFQHIYEYQYLYWHSVVCLGDDMYVMFQVRIELSTKVCDSADRVRDTLLHELCHAAVWIIDGENGGHGPVWKRWYVHVSYSV